jgi:predicted peroxiredoxin
LRSERSERLDTTPPTLDLMRELIIKCTTGAEAPERANQAFTVAAAAVAAGAPVSLWLTGEAAWFGVPGRAEEFELELATPLAELRDIVLAGGTLTVCSQCAQRRGLVEADLVEGVRISGAAVFAEQVLGDGVQALVY